MEIPNLVSEGNWRIVHDGVVQYSGPSLVTICLSLMGPFVFCSWLPKKQPKTRVPSQNRHIAGSNERFAFGHLPGQRLVTVCMFALDMPIEHA